MFVQYIDMQSMLDLHEGSERAQGLYVGMQLWEWVILSGGIVVSGSDNAEGNGGDK